MNLFTSFVSDVVSGLLATNIIMVLNFHSGILSPYVCLGKVVFASLHTQLNELFFPSSFTCKKNDALL